MSSQLHSPDSYQSPSPSEAYLVNTSTRAPKGRLSTHPVPPRPLPPLLRLPQNTSSPRLSAHDDTPAPLNQGWAKRKGLGRAEYRQAIVPWCQLDALLRAWERVGHGRAELITGYHPVMSARRLTSSVGEEGKQAIVVVVRGALLLGWTLPPCHCPNDNYFACARII